MYCLSLFYKGSNTPVKLRHEDELKLEGYAVEAQEQALVSAWRIVHIEAGKCINYWKEGECDGHRAYGV